MSGDGLYGTICRVAWGGGANRAFTTSNDATSIPSAPYSVLWAGYSERTVEGGLDSGPAAGRVASDAGRREVGQILCVGVFRGSLLPMFVSNLWSLHISCFVCNVQTEASFTSMTVLHSRPFTRLAKPA